MNVRRIPIPRYRQSAGPALLAQGFRPFFLASGAWAALALVLWLCQLTGHLMLPSAFDPLSWHTHEMLFGFATATIAGFLLTAIPNWTGRMPLQGAPLLALVSLWLAGRVAMATSDWIGTGLAAAIDLGFLAALLAVVLREIVAGRNWRNLPMGAALLVLLVGNGLMHAEAAELVEGNGVGWRLALSMILMLIGLVGGRIIPSFTRNWLTKRAPGRMPAPFGVPDSLALVTTGGALALWSALPDAAPTAAALAVAGLSQAARLARWCGHRTRAEALVWVLHLGYAWLPLGLILLAGAAWSDAIPASMAIHALTVGAVGTMTLAVMTRATLGHTARALAADGVTTSIYVAVTLAAASRLAAAALPNWMMALLVISGVCWIIAFGGFALVYGRYLLRPRT